MASLNGHGKFIAETGFKILLDDLGCYKEAFKLQFEKWALDSDWEISEEVCVELFKNGIDNGRPHEVVLKFMRYTVQF